MPGFSNGWLTAFKQRHNLCQWVRHSEAGVVGCEQLKLDLTVPNSCLVKQQPIKLFDWLAPPLGVPATPTSIITPTSIFQIFRVLFYTFDLTMQGFMYKSPSFIEICLCFYLHLELFENWIPNSLFFLIYLSLCLANSCL